MKIQRDLHKEKKMILLPFLNLSMATKFHDGKGFICITETNVSMLIYQSTIAPGGTILFIFTTPRVLERYIYSIRFSVLKMSR